MRQWLRAAVLGSNDGLVSVSSLMMGASAAHVSLLPVATASISAGALSMAVGEYVSVRSEGTVREGIQASLSSALSFISGGIFPFIGGYLGNTGIISFTLTGLFISGILSARSADKPIVKTTLRVVLGGILGMAITSLIGSLV